MAQMGHVGGVHNSDAVIVGGLAALAAGVAMIVGRYGMKAILGAAVAAMSIAGGAQAATLDFEGLGASWAGTSLGQYGGFAWSNFWILDTEVFSTVFPLNGYDDAVTSGKTVAYNGFASPASFSRVGGGTFILNALNLGAVYVNGLTVLIEGYSGSDLAYSRSVLVDVGSTLVTLDWTGLTSVSFSSGGGSNAFGGFWYGAEHPFAMDDITLDMPVGGGGVVTPPQVPLPASVVMLGGAVAGLGALRRRRLTGQRPQA